MLALKTLSRNDQTRPQDRIDIVALLRVATDADLRIAEQALASITQRGCNRGQDLAAMLARSRAESAL